MKLQKVLCVEDEEDIRLIVQRSLAIGGIRDVRMVADSRRAIEAMREFAPDLVLLDWMMPEVDGITLLRQLRRDPQLRHLPVVFLTALADRLSINDLSHEDIAGIITKPFSVRALAQQLDEIFEALPARPVHG